MADGGGGKSSGLWLVIIGIWSAATGVLVWRLLPGILISPPFAFLVACLSFFLLSGVFNIVVNVASHVLRETPPVGGPTAPGPVTILYCTYNDFDRRAADSLRSLTYPDLRVWVLDDSTRDGFRADVDTFAREATAQGLKVEVHRRSDRKGFKAGAINAALARLPPEIGYVAIVDSDETLAPDFIQGCLRHFTRDDIAFVQASHRCYNQNAGWFTRYLGIGVDLHWRHYQQYRNRFGTVNMLGHGAIIRRDVLETVGGFPEVTCEDLAFTVTARMAGYRGAFAADVVCGETFPEDFSAMRRRHLRWSWATVEFLRRFMVPFARSRARWFEKLDLLLPSVNLPAVLLFLGFLLSVNLLRWTGADLSLFVDTSVVALSLLASLGPLAMFVDLWRRPGFALKVIVLNTIAYLALFPVSVYGMLQGIARPAEFFVTPKGVKGHLPLGRAISETRMEIAAGAALLAVGTTGMGPAGLASPLAIAALLTPILMTTSRSSLLRGRGLLRRPAAASETG